MIPSPNKAEICASSDYQVQVSVALIVVFHDSIKPSEKTDVQSDVCCNNTLEPETESPKFSSGLEPDGTGNTAVDPLISSNA